MNPKRILSLLATAGTLYGCLAQTSVVAQQTSLHAAAAGNDRAAIERLLAEGDTQSKPAGESTNQGTHQNF